ncbi:MAG: UDP-2,4-diacetamido-2,4,6-trideoxy-beta-L-altropyranose hydrolase [Alphaproteobacteria bacterium]
MTPHLLTADGATVQLRPAVMADCEVLLDWQRQPQTRRYFRNPEPPADGEHAAWMQARIAEKMIWMLMLGDEAVGMVRLENKDDGAAEVSVLIDSARHGMGLGAAALALVRAAHPTRTLVADVHPDNAASHALFRGGGYEKDGDIYICPPRRGVAVFRCDAGPGIGGGHVMRCLALAGRLSDDGWSVAFACSAETPATVPALAEARYPMIDAADAETMTAAWADGVDWLIVDHYGLDAEFETACRDWARRILVIDDLADRPHACDVLLDQTPGRTRQDYGLDDDDPCRTLFGADYAILRPEFAAARSDSLRRRDTAEARRLMIFCGTVDRVNLTATALQALDGLGFEAVDVVLGSTAPHLQRVQQLAGAAPCPVTVHVDVQDMAGLLAAADIAVGAAGTASWERCCLGLPTVVTATADNQRRIADELTRAKAATVVGWHEDVTPVMIGEALSALCGEVALRRNMSSAAAALCDGLGLDRLAGELAYGV